MLTSHHTLHLLATTLDEALRGKAVTEAYSQERNHLVVGFGPAVPALIISCVPRAAVLYLHPRQARARRNSANVLAALRERVVQSVTIHPSDRLITVAVSGGLRLIALCYGNTPNALLVDEDGRVSDAFLDAKRLLGSSFHLPVVTDAMIPDIGAADRGLDESPELTALEVLRRAYPRLGQTLVREVLHRAGIPSTARGVDEGGRERIRSALVALYRDLAEPRPLVYVRGERETPVALSLLPLQHLHPLTVLPFDGIHDAVRFFLARSRASQHADTERRDLTVALDRTIERTRRTIAAVEEELAGGNRGMEYERCGRLLLTNLDAVKRGDRTVSLPDGEEHRTITLDPRLTPAANADRYFEKGKTARTARREATARLEQLRAHATLAAGLREQIDEAETTDDLRRLLQERGPDLETLGIRKGGVAAADLPPFRMFTVEGGFQVWAGKSSANNDDLTLHHCRPDDLWFHARGGSGAHVVLRVSTGRGEPGKRAREQAAGIAAYYSKMKTAGMVPVAMTLRKYVRKPKGAPPGTVIIERETVLFARPALPERQEAHH